MTNNCNVIKVLVIDDHRTMRKIIRKLLNDLGIRDVEEAEDGEMAIKRLSDRKLPPVDMVICDLYMEGMDGMQFLSNLRRDKSLAELNIPVVMLTGEKDSMVLEVCQQVGAASVATKPVTANQLKEHMEDACGCSLETIAAALV